jgi:hypothetical protein
MTLIHCPGVQGDPGTYQDSKIGRNGELPPAIREHNGWIMIPLERMAGHSQSAADGMAETIRASR